MIFENIISDREGQIALGVIFGFFGYFLIYFLSWIPSEIFDKHKHNKLIRLFKFGPWGAKAFGRILGFALINFGLCAIAAWSLLAIIPALLLFGVTFAITYWLFK